MKHLNLLVFLSVLVVSCASTAAQPPALTAEQPKVTEIITTCVAVVAFLLSVYNFYVYRRNTRSRLLIWVSKGNNSSGKETEYGLFVEVANPTDRPIQVTDVHVSVGKNTPRLAAYNIYDQHQEAHLPPRERTVFWLPIISVRDVFKERPVPQKIIAKAHVRDAIGHIHSSRKDVQLLSDEFMRH